MSSHNNSHDNSRDHSRDNPNDNPDGNPTNTQANPPDRTSPDKSASAAAAALRARGEAALRRDSARAPLDLATLTPAAIGAMLHDLQVHQIELEMQNDELRRAQLQIEAARARYANLYEFAPVGYCTLGDTGMILEANLCAAGMLGTPRGKLVGKPFSRFIHPEDADIFQLMRKTCLRGNGNTACELRLRNNDSAGRPFWALLTASTSVPTPAPTPVPAPAAADEPDTAVMRLTISDISAQKSAAAQRIETQKAQLLGSLAAGLAHNFNNILSIIRGNARLAIEDSKDNQSALISLHEIAKSAARACDLVQAIVWFGRRESPQQRAVSIGPLVEDSAQLLRATLPLRFAILVHPAAMLPAVNVDAHQIERVIINVATNAMQAVRGASGRFDIYQDTVMLDETLAATDPQLALMHQRHPGTSVRIRLEDDGPGMDSATLNRVFEPFFSTRSPSEGAGLGLPVAQGIMQAHEGAITIQSTPGHGTTVTLYLPLAAVPGMV